MRIAIIGAGNVGRALGRRWVEVAHQVRYGVRNPGDPKHAGLSGLTTISEAAAFAEVVLLATPWAGARDAVLACGDLSGKVLVDATNPIASDFSGLLLGHTTSAGEQVAAWAGNSRVVKAFNTIGSNIMENPDFGGVPATLLYAGDDPSAKEIVAKLARDLGFTPEDAGPLQQARLLEAQAWLWITLALKYGYGRDIAFRLMRR